MIIEDNFLKMILNDRFCAFSVALNIFVKSRRCLLSHCPIVRSVVLLNKPKHGLTSNYVWVFLMCSPTKFVKMKVLPLFLIELWVILY